MYRDVMLAITQTEGDDRALQAGVDFCRVMDARLSVSVPFDLPMATADAYGTTPIVLEESFAELRKDASREVTRIRSKLEVADVRFDVHLAEAQVYASKALLALEARYHDIVMLTAPGSRREGAEADVIHIAFSSLVLDSGRPVLTVPRRGKVVFPAARIAIGWQPTPEATRAVHDALPLLRKAQQVDLILIDPLVGERRHGEEPGADIAAHLARHDVEVDVFVQPSARGPAGTDLMLTAQERGADLLVIGAYGHSRAREWAFGGVTRELLERADVPVLFSH